MRETRTSGSVEGVMGNHGPYSDSCRLRPRHSRFSVGALYRREGQRSGRLGLRSAERPVPELG